MGEDDAMDMDDLDLDEALSMGEPASEEVMNMDDLDIGGAPDAGETPTPEGGGAGGLERGGLLDEVKPKARRGGRKMFDMKRVLVLFVVVGFVLILGLFAFSLRYKTTVLNGSVLLIDRWFDRTALIHGDGSFDSIDRGRPITRRMFSSQLVEDHGVRVTTGAYWRSGRMYVLVRARPYTDEIKKARKSRKPAYVISLQDRRGFAVYTFNVPLYKMRPIEDDEGNVVELEYRVTKAIHRDNFRAIRTWELR
jgi:hypothetical protein